MIGRLLRTGVLLAAFGSLAGCEGCGKTPPPPATEWAPPAAGEQPARRASADLADQRRAPPPA